MAKYNIYPNAPIIEAVLEIRLSTDHGLTLKNLEPLIALVSKKYPTNKQTHRFKGEIIFNVDKKSSSKIEETINGYQFATEDKLQIAQMRLDGFTFSRLKPYEEWKNFCKEAKDLWDKYINIIKHPNIVRIALRYINRIDIPLSANLNDYLKAPPIIPKDGTHKMDGFLTRVSLYKTTDLRAIVTQSSEKPTKVDCQPIILDIDVFERTEKDLPESQVWEKFNKLRKFRNEIFFGSITKKTEEMFQ